MWYIMNNDRCRVICDARNRDIRKWQEERGTEGGREREREREYFERNEDKIRINGNMVIERDEAGVSYLETKYLEYLGIR